MDKLSRHLQERFLTNPMGDLIGGLLAAIVALPLCLAFGVASGLGAAAGLYGAIACGILAAVFGGTPGQCSGPTGPMTVVAAAILSANQSHPQLLFASVIAAGMAQIAIGYLKGGELVHYMPYPVISGFMTGIGAIIVCLQIEPLFGVPGSGNVLDAIQSLPQIFGHFNSEAVVIGGCALAIIYLLPHLSKRLPASLIALLVTTWMSQVMHMNVPCIGEIPSGLPCPQLPLIQLSDLHMVLQNGLTLAVLGSIDSLLTSLVLDKVTGGRHDSNQELIGQGLGNMMSGLIGGVPGAGATMRSMVNVRAGGKTYLSGVIHGLVLLLVLLGLGATASIIPHACLAAILISVGLGIMDWRVLKGIGKVPRADILVMLTVLTLTIFVDLIVAVLAGIALASVIFVKQLSDAQVSSVKDLDTLEELKELTDHIPELVRKSIYMYQLNGPLFFGEAKNLTASIDKLSQARYIILRFYNVPLIDQTGALALEGAVEKWEANGIKVLFVGMQKHIRQILEATGAIHKIEMENCFEQFEDAIKAIDVFETRLPGS